MDEKKKFKLEEFLSSDATALTLVAACTVVEHLEGVTFSEEITRFLSDMRSLLTLPSEEYATGLPSWTLRIGLSHVYEANDKSNDSEVGAELVGHFTRNRGLSRVLHRKEDDRFTHVIQHVRTFAVPYIDPQSDTTDQTVRYYDFEMRGFFESGDVKMQVIWWLMEVIESDFIQVFVPGEDRAVMFAGDVNKYTDPFSSISAAPQISDKFIARWNGDDSDAGDDGLDVYYAEGWSAQRLCGLLRNEGGDVLEQS